MKKTKWPALFAVVAALLLSHKAFANLEIAVMAGASQNKVTASSDLTATYESANGTRFGGLILFPLLPTLSVRTGAIYHTRKLKVSASSPVAYELEFTNKTMDIPLNLQFNFPVTSLYLFGGMILSNTQSTDCTSNNASITCSSDKTPSDQLMNVGFGFNVFSLALVRLSLEAEHQIGSKDLLDGAGELKQSSTNLGAVFAFGF